MVVHTFDLYVLGLTYSDFFLIEFLLYLDIGLYNYFVRQLFLTILFNIGLYNYFTFSRNFSYLVFHKLILKG